MFIIIATMSMPYVVTAFLPTGHASSHQFPFTVTKTAKSDVSD